MIAFWRRSEVSLLHVCSAIGFTDSPGERDRVEVSQINLRSAGECNVFADPIRVGNFGHLGELLQSPLIKLSRCSETKAKAVHKEVKIICQGGKLHFAAMIKMFSGDLETLKVRRMRPYPGG